MSRSNSGLLLLDFPCPGENKVSGVPTTHTPHHPRLRNSAIADDREGKEGVRFEDRLPKEKRKRKKEGIRGETDRRLLRSKETSKRKGPMCYRCITNYLAKTVSSSKLPLVSAGSRRFKSRTRSVYRGFHNLDPAVWQKRIAAVASP